MRKLVTLYVSFLFLIPNIVHAEWYLISNHYVKGPQQPICFEIQEVAWVNGEWINAGNPINDIAVTCPENAGKVWMQYKIHSPGSPFDLPYANYCFKVRAINDYAPSEWSEIYVLDTGGIPHTCMLFMAGPPLVPEVGVVDR